MIIRETYLRAAPPLLLGAGLLLWGWQNGFLVYAIIMGLLLEITHYVNWRWPITDKEFNNLTDLSGLGFFIVIVYIFIDKGAEGIYTILSIIPFVLFLLILVQLFSDKGGIKLSALFISLRKLDTDKSPELNRYIDISLPYFMVCIISASAGNIRTIWFFLSCCLLFAITMWLVRPRKRYRITTWALLVVLSFCVAYAGQAGIRNLQATIEQNFMGMFDRFMWRFRDPDRATTAIGSLGRLKLSDRILVRIKPDRALTEPLYLYESSYNSYNYGVWSTVKPAFESVDSDPGGSSWTLNNDKPDRSAEISVYMINQAGVIPVPLGTSKIRGPGIVAVNENNYGTIKMEMHEGWIKYSTDYQNDSITAPPPSKYDLSVSDTYRTDFEKFADQLQLRGKPEQEIVDKVRKTFLEHYTYSLTRKQRYPRGRYLADFLFNSKSGHCEYFATATVLLLRTLGIPARYAVGYATQEYSILEGQYIARSRHAHSWVLAFVNGHWIQVDTTPSVWAPEEEKGSSALQPVIDLLSWINFKISRWRSGEELEDEKTSYSLLWLLIPLGLLLFWRMYFKERIQKIGIKRETLVMREFQGRDSIFYRLVEQLEIRGYSRIEGETLYQWLKRIDYIVSGKKLSRALMLHYQYRFDPAGLNKRAKEEFNDLVSELMMEIKTST